MILKKRLSGPFRLLSSIWFFLPLCILILNALSIFDVQVRSIPSSQRALSWTVIFPLCVSMLAFHMHCWKRAAEMRRQYVSTTITFLLFLLVFFGIVFIRADQPYPSLDMKMLFEISTGLFFVLFLIHSISYESIDTTVALFVIGFLYGIILENGGIMLGFFRETGFHAYIPFLPAPLFTSLGWCNVFYSCRFCAHLIFGRNKSSADIAQEREKPTFRKALSFAVIVTISALFLDFQLDPFATHHKLWIWNEELIPFFGGVPLINFTAWLSAIFPFAFTIEFLERSEKYKERKFSLRLLVLLPLVLLTAVFLVLSLTFICEGYTSASMKIFLGAGGLL